MKNHYSVFILLCTLVINTLGCQASPTPVNGAPGIGDPYYPNLGNGGYDVQSYTIKLEIDPPTNTITGSTTILATTTEALVSFNLDFHGLTVDTVTVNKKVAQFSRKADELTITPAKPLKLNKSFTVVVEYHGLPELILSQAIPVEVGWAHANNGAINVLSEPEGASTWFPNNNHPRDKATYIFEITVPQPWIVAATGTLKETKKNGDSNTFIWEMAQPMATYLASINVDQYELFTQSGPNGMTIRSYFPIDFPSSQRLGANILPAAIDYFDGLFGPYPFEEYGIVIANTEGLCKDSDFALETQSMSVHCPSITMTSEVVIVHELAHQWFGDSVSLENWKDIWLKEGFATYAEWLWTTRNRDLNTLNRVVKAQMVGYYPGTATGDPPVGDLYRNEVYKGGALVFHALRLTVGEDMFFKIIQTYLEKYRGNYAGTDEFIALSEEISGQDLQEFFDSWLLDNKLPAMPELK